MGERLITYETIYEYLRNEKNKESLQSLDSAFFDDVAGYIREKEQIYQDTAAKSDVFSIRETDKIAQQLRNVRNILQDLYTRREKKIIDLAINLVRTRSTVVDSSQVHKREKPFFDAVVSLLEQYRGDILSGLLRPGSGAPARSQNTQAARQGYESTVSLTQDSDSSRSHQSSHKHPPQPTASPVSEQSSSTTDTQAHTSERIPAGPPMLEFLGEVDAFIDADLNEFGPFGPGDQASIPPEIASILIAEGKARKVRN